MAWLSPFLNHGSSPRMWGTLIPLRKGDKIHRFIPTHVGNTWPEAGSSRTTTVHPHACGEHWSIQNEAAFWPGSSPRMWGTQVLADAGHLGHRFIPTHVGNTSTGFTHRRDGAVHPHACGEHVGTPGRPRNWGGSSPRMWGTLWNLQNRSI